MNKYKANLLAGPPPQLQVSQTPSISCNAKGFRQKMLGGLLLIIRRGCCAMYLAHTQTLDQSVITRAGGHIKQDVLCLRAH
jgi:hypothetical protein